MQNWKKIGPVTIHWAEVQRSHFKDDGWCNYKQLDFKSLQDAVKWLGCGWVRSLEYGHLKKCWYDTSVLKPIPYEMWKGDSIIIRDESGMIIPPWKLKEVFNNLPRDCDERRLWRVRRYHQKRTKYIKNERGPFRPSF